jgi:hypothetical protein
MACRQVQSYRDRNSRRQLQSDSSALATDAEIGNLTPQGV